jgi:rubrerythrin
MVTKFDVHGVLQIAESVEHKGARFYLQAAERFIDPQCSDLCRQLAGWRSAEEDILGRRKSKISKRSDEPPKSAKTDYISANPFVMASLESFARGTGRWARLTGRESANGILRIAIVRAKDAIAFYRGLKDFVHDPAGIEVLDIIIEEEKEHIKALADRLTASQKQNPLTAAES